MALLGVALAAAATAQTCTHWAGTGKEWSIGHPGLVSAQIAFGVGGPPGAGQGGVSMNFMDTLHSTVTGENGATETVTYSLDNPAGVLACKQACCDCHPCRGMGGFGPMANCEAVSIGGGMGGTCTLVMAEGPYTMQAEADTQTFWKVDSSRVGVSGDPFTHDHDGKQVQFFLTPGEDTLLATCGSVAVHGRVMPSAAGDKSQWFDAFRVTVDGKDLVAVERADPTPLLANLSDTTVVGGKVDTSVDVGVAKVKKALDSKRTADSEDLPDIDVVAQPGQEKLNLPLRTVNVTVGGQQSVSRTAVVHPFGGEEATVTIVRGETVIASRVVSEVITVAVRDISLTVKSATAGKFTGAADRVRHMHLDLDFGSIPHDKYCSGILPEIWGMRPMSKETAKMMNPH